MTLTDLLFISLATLYLSYALTKSEGPYKAFETIRQKIPLGGLTACLICLSFWVGLLMTLLYALIPLAVEAVAVAGLVILIAQYTGMLT